MARAESGLVECTIEVVALLGEGPPHADNESAEPLTQSEKKTAWKMEPTVPIVPRKHHCDWVAALGVMLRRNRNSNPVA